MQHNKFKQKKIVLTIFFAQMTPNLFCNLHIRHKIKNVVLPYQKF